MSTPSLKRILFVIFIIVSMILIYILKDIALLFFASFVMASAINPVVDFFAKRFKRTTAVLIVYLLGFIIMTLFLIPFVDVLVNQTMEFIKLFPVYIHQFEIHFDKLLTMYKGMEFLPDISQALPAAGNFSQNIVSSSINFTINFITGLAIVFTLALIVYYMIQDKNELREGFLRFFPNEMRAKTEEITNNIAKKVGGYVIGQVLFMIITAVLTAVGYIIIGLDFALLLGFLAGVLDIVPLIGPAIALILAILVALAKKPILILWVVIIFSLVQWAGNTFLKPVIFSRFLDLHPLIIILALLVSASTMGVVGVILSPAIAATIYVLIEELYLKRINS